MQRHKLGEVARYSASCLLFGVLLLAPPSRAQVDLETAQQVNDRIRSLSASARMKPHDYVIGSGDVLSIEVFDVRELSREVRVSQTGSIGIPLVPVRLHVAGLTEIQAEQKITEVLEANGLVSHAQVTVSVRERKSKPITVVGAVGHPMVYQADRPVSILEVLAEAGGVASDAGDTVIVTRPAREPRSDPSDPPALLEEPASRNTPEVTDPPGLSNTITVNLHELMESGDATNNMVLEAGDIVTVPHAGVVYVLGAVGKAGGFVLLNDRAQMTTLKILALAGGLNRTAKKDHAVIIRKDNQGQQHEVALDLKKIMERKAEDVQLLPSDVLYVPDSAGKQAALRAAEFGIALASGVALYRVVYH